MEGVSFAACGEANDLKLVPTKRAAMRGWFFALSVQPAAAMIPRTGGPGRAKPPGPSFPPFLREEMGVPAGRPVPPLGGRHVWRPYGFGRIISASTGMAVDVRAEVVARHGPVVRGADGIRPTPTERNE